MSKRGAPPAPWGTMDGVLTPANPPRLAQQAHEPYPSPCPCALRAIGSNGSTSRCFVYPSAFVYLFSGPSYWGYGQCK